MLPINVYFVADHTHAVRTESTGNEKRAQRHTANSVHNRVNGKIVMSLMMVSSCPFSVALILLLLLAGSRRGGAGIDGRPEQIQTERNVEHHNGHDGRVDVGLHRRHPVVEDEQLEAEERDNRREDDQQTVEQDDEECAGVGGV